MAYNNELFVDMSRQSSYEELASMDLDKKPVKGIVQPPIKPPAEKPHRNTDALQYMLSVLKAIFKHPDSWPFKKPVNASYLKIPDYHTIIKYPIDLCTVKRRILNFYYYDVKECIKDVRLVFFNCYLYNKKDTEVVSMAKSIEEIFVREMANCPDKEIEIPLPVKETKNKRKVGKKEDVYIKTEAHNSVYEMTAVTSPVERNLKPNHSASGSSQTSNMINRVPTSQAENTSKLWTCPECRYNSKNLQDFLLNPIVGGTSDIETWEISEVCAHSTPNSSFSSYDKKIDELQKAVKKMDEKVKSFEKEMNEQKNKRLERQARNQRRNDAILVPIVKQKIVNDLSLPVTVLPADKFSASTSAANKALNGLQKQTKKSASKCHCAPNSAAQTKRRGRKRKCSPEQAVQSKGIVPKCKHAPKLTGQTKNLKTNPNPRKKQSTYVASACSLPISTALSNGGKKETEDADLKPMSYEEIKKLRKELAKLDGADHDESSSSSSSCNGSNSSTGPFLYGDNTNFSYDNSKRDMAGDVSSSSNSEAFLYYSDNSCSSNYNAKDGKKNSNDNGQSLVSIDINPMTAPPDSTTSPTKVQPILAGPNPPLLFPNLLKNVIKTVPNCGEFKSSNHGPSTSGSVSKLNIGRPSHAIPKEISSRTCMINSIDVDRHYGYTRITKRVQQVEKNAKFNDGNQRFKAIIEKAKVAMYMRFDQAGNQAFQPGNVEVKIKKEKL